MSNCDPPILGFTPPGASASDCGVTYTVSGWCDSLGNPVDVHYIRDCDTLSLTVLYVDPSTGSPVVPSLPLVACGGGGGGGSNPVALCDPLDPDSAAVRTQVSCYVNYPINSAVEEIPPGGSQLYPYLSGNLVSLTVTAPNGVTITTSSSGPVSFPPGSYSFNAEFGRVLLSITVDAPGAGPVFVHWQETI